MAEINSYAERRALEGLKLKSFKSLNLKDIKEKLEVMLNEIGRNGMFSEYTIHNISHVDGMLALLDFIVPESVKSIMTPTDWMMTVLSVYFHDLGMLITNDEFKKRYSNEDFMTYNANECRDSGDTTDDYFRTMYQDYVRKHHGDRIFNWIANINAPVEDGNPVQKYLYDMLNGIGNNVCRDLAQLCKSHQDEFDNLDEFETDKQYEQDPKSQYNKLFVAALLRVADLLHVNSERAPEDKFLLISPQNPYSRREWVQQKSISCIRPRKEKDREGNVDDSIQQHCFEVLGEFKDEEAFSHFQSYLDYAEREIKKVYLVCKDSQRKNNNSYSFPWDEIDRDRIKTVGFSASKLQFSLDKENILNLLIGHTLYNHTNVVLRELTQNALDAVRLMYHGAKEGEDNKGKVNISWDSNKRLLKISDNGTGMNEHIILNYLFKVGASLYRSEEFKKKNPDFHSISRFGIGLLTCFMISDEIDIVTLHHSEKACHSIKVRNHNGQYYMRNDEETTSILGHRHGTTFTLKVRDDAKMEDIEGDLKRWILVPEAEVTLSIDGRDIKVGYQSEEQAMESFLTSCGIKVDNNNYKIASECDGCSTILTLLHKNSIYGFWEHVYLSELHIREQSPVGIYIEGIQVETNSPGMKSERIVSLVNCKGDTSPSTNVARDRMEGGERMNEVYRSIYNAYLNHILQQMNEMKNLYSYSLTMNMVYCGIERLTSSRTMSNVLSSSDIFDECLQSKKLILLDNGENWNITSLDELPEKICTIDSRANLSAVNLLSEIKDSPKTPLQLIKELHKDSKYEDVNKVLADSFAENYLYRLFRKQYQITEIRCDRNKREFILGWEKGRSPWIIVNLNIVRHFPSLDYVYLQKPGEEIVFDAKESENVIVTQTIIYLVGHNDLFDYLNTLYCTDSDDAEIAFKIAVTFVAKSILSNGKGIARSFDTFFSSNDNYLGEDIWKYIDKKKLEDAFVNTKLIDVNFNKYYDIKDRYGY